VPGGQVTPLGQRLLAAALARQTGDPFDDVANLVARAFAMVSRRRRRA